jgi:hypothetical protein
MFILRGISVAFRIEEVLLCKAHSCNEDFGVALVAYIIVGF